MPVSLHCPAGHRMTVSRRCAGRTVRCPKCGRKVRIPSLETIERKLQAKQRGKPTRPSPLPPRAVEAGASEAGASEASIVEAPPPRRRGYKAERGRQWMCFGLGLSLLLLGALGAAPAAYEIADYVQSDQTVPVARWAWLALLAALVHFAYAVYVMQLPDWSTAWAVTLASAALATGYAFLLGLTLVAGAESRVVALLELQDQLAHARAARWCFVMLGALGVYAYFAGRAALAWRRAYQRVQRK